MKHPAPRHVTILLMEGAGGFPGSWELLSLLIIATYSGNHMLPWPHRRRTALGTELYLRAGADRFPHPMPLLFKNRRQASVVRSPDSSLCTGHL